MLFSESHTCNDHPAQYIGSHIVLINVPNRTVTVSPMVNLNIAMKSEAASEDGQDFIPAANVRVVDTVHYTNLTSHRKYTMETQFVLKSNSEILATVSKDFYPPDGPSDTNTASGSVTLEAEINVSQHPGDYVVACDYLYEYVKGTKILIACHADMEDDAQTLRIPSISTTARDADTGDNSGTVKEDAKIIDTVSYTNLKQGEKFRLVAKLVYRDEFTDEYGVEHLSGEPVPINDDSENHVIFTADASEMTVTLSYAVDSDALSGKTTVVFEDLLHNGVTIASHSDLTDEEQSVHFPDIRTNAIDKTSNTSFVTRGSEVFFVDTVSYSKLIPGETYIVYGRLMEKETGKDLGCTAQSEQFIAESSEGSVTVEFIVNTEEFGSGIIVVFEDLHLVKEDGSEVMLVKHEDLEDDDQSLYFPEIRTTAVNAETGTHEAQGKVNTVIEDTVT